MRILGLLLILPLLSSLMACGNPTATASSADAEAEASIPLPLWLSNASVLVDGHAADDLHANCRQVICRHNENTDMTLWKGSIWLVHRTALSQTLGPNSALHVYQSTDSGQTFTQTAIIPAPVDRDIRDPSFYQVGGDLYLKALTRLPVSSPRDSNVDTVAMGTHSSDGTTWTPIAPMGPHGWSFWRIRQQADSYYTAAYQDGDKGVVLYTSKDGLSWAIGPSVYAISADTPSETELTFMPSGKLLALVRMDGVDTELLGDQGRLRTKVCWASPPYGSFDCPSELDGERLDGPVTFFAKGRLFVVARKHLQGTGRKRTSLFEITGTFDGGPIAIHEWGELPSSGDTSYAGVAMTDASHALLTWYSSDLSADYPWGAAFFESSDIWKGTVDIDRLR